MSSHLKRPERDRLEAALRARQQALRARMTVQFDGQSRVDHAREVLLQDGDDAPQRDADREVDLAVTDMEGSEYAAIDRALGRLAAGTYGECIDCGDAIPFARLTLEPHAQRCIACETAHERLAPRTASL